MFPCMHGWLPRGGHIWFLQSPPTQVLPVGGSDVWPLPFCRKCLRERSRHRESELKKILARLKCTCTYVVLVYFPQDLPASVDDSQSSQQRSASSNASTSPSPSTGDEQMKIAWRYQSLPKVQVRDFLKNLPCCLKILPLQD